MSRSNVSARVFRVSRRPFFHSYDKRDDVDNPRQTCIMDRKRKRASTAAVNPPEDSEVVDLRYNGDADSSSVASTPPPADEDVPEIVAPKKASRKRQPKLVKEKSNTVELTASWPKYFQDLLRKFKSLNLVYTFCYTQKQLALTFENLKAAIQHQTRYELTIDDIAQIKFLMPECILFSYVDAEEYEAEFEDEVYTGTKDPKYRSEQSSEILLFEFIDENLKGSRFFRNERKMADRLKNVDKKAKGLIEKRNDKFITAISSFLESCSSSCLDPLLALESQFKPHVPLKPSKSEDKLPAFSRIPSEIPKERASIPEIVDELVNSEFYHSQIVEGGYQIFDAREVRYGELKFPLSQGIVDALYNARGVQQLYLHQASALNDLHDGANVIVTTPTSSGKSLIYQIPVLRELEVNPDCRAIYIFPTKALAQDQKKALVEILWYMQDTLGPVRVDTYDGDTPMADRRSIRDEARVIFTNPDMLHINVLPNEGQWRHFLQNLRYVVVDELHVYNGLFGTHFAFIIRRLRRVCAAIGNNKVKFISCSATVSNPVEHMKTTFGIDNVKLTSEDGAPSGAKTFLCWNSPLKDPNDSTSGRVDPVQESANLFVELVLRGVRVVSFCRVRKVCELMFNAVKNGLTAMGRQEVNNRVMSYRSGYTAADRRRIEAEMFDGKLMGIVATNALELGVDIGSLDAVIMVGFPYTIMNLRQQSGRAGRRNKDSLSILVGDSFPLDQHYMSNPSHIVTTENPALQIDLDNLLILEGHVQCAAYEMPIRPDDDAKFFGPSLKALAKDRLVEDENGWFHCNGRFRPLPSKHVQIRDTEDGHFAVVDITNGRNVVLEEVEPSRATFTLYEGGLFLHQGYKYLVKEFSTDKRLAKVVLVNVDWTTRQRDYTDIDPIETDAVRYLRHSPYKCFHGPIRIKATVFGFFKIDKNGRLLDTVEVDNPPIEIMSKGMWLDVPKPAIEILNLKRLNVAGAIHAAEHAIVSLLPNFVISATDDVRTDCKTPQKEFAKKETSRKRPARLMFYDAKGGSGGSGVSTKAFEFIDVLMRMAVKRVGNCDCAEGCPECVATTNCREANAVLSKAGSQVILKSLLNLPIDIDALPEGPEELAPAGIETVVVADEVKLSQNGIVYKREDSDLNSDDDSIYDTK